MKGKLIVIDGTDGSGKHTQTGLLIKNLRARGRKVATLDFPQYYNNFFGALLKKYLSGDFGNPVEISPYLTSVLFAADRFESSQKIKNWLKRGYVVILDRYVSSNQIHQGAKIKNYKKRKEFLEWLDKMEFGIFKLPRPNIIVYLHVDPKTAQKLIAKKSRRADGYEKNIVFQRASEKQSQKLVKEMNNWKKIECVIGGKLLSPEDISREVLVEVEKIISRDK